MILLFRYDPSGRFDMGNATSVVTVVFGLGILFLLTTMSLKNDIYFDYMGLTNRNLWSILKMSSIIVLTLLSFILILTLVFHYVKNPPQSRAFFTVMNIIIFSATSLFLLYFVKDYKFTNPYMKLIKNVIMYIPCLVYDLIDEAKYQYSITTPTAYIILGVDIAFIMMNYLWKKIQIYWRHRQKEGGLLLEGPVFLNRKNVLGTYENMVEAKATENFSYQYGLSFWVYINPQPPSTSIAHNEYAILFDYGGKPTLLYKADENKLKIQMRMNEHETKNIYLGSDMKLQKWNHFIINYDKGTLDVILNDTLISSSSSIAPYMSLDVVSVGQNNGINGGIRDVVYFRKPVV